MKRYGYRAAAVVSLLCTALASSAPAWGHDVKNVNVKVDARLYEVTENMALDDLSHPTLRTATAALQGTAKLGSSLCPVDLVNLLSSLGLLTSAHKPCTITAIGSDEVSTVTGAGKLTGTFSTVINLDNTSDAAEFVVMTGTFEGSMQVLVDMSVNPPKQLPLIALTGGTLTPVDVMGMPIKFIGMLGLDPDTFQPAPFGGVFRLPFALDRRGTRVKPHPTRDAFYLGDHGQLIRVQPNERSLGFPTVRVEIDF